MATTSTQNTTLLIPCAGFGTRVGQPLAKEMFPNPATGQPLILRALTLAETHRWPTVVITRPEKKNLIEYVERFSREKGLELHFVFVNNTREWPESILKSRRHWREKNLVVLPDTEWSPEDLPARLTDELNSFDVAFATFQADDPRTWGTIKTQSDKLQICEKPANKTAGFSAWGLFSFKKFAGEKLLQGLLESTLDHQIKTLDLKSTQVSLDTFTDLTRG